MKKYKFVEQKEVVPGIIAGRIEALRDIPFQGVKAGDWGGFIQYEENLPHSGDSWVADEAVVIGRLARIEDSALIEGNAMVRGDSCILDNAVVSGHAYLDDAVLCGQDIRINDRARLNQVGLTGNRIVIGGDVELRNITTGTLLENVSIGGHASMISGNEKTLFSGKNISIQDHVKIQGADFIEGDDLVFSKQAVVKDGVKIQGNAIELTDDAVLSGKLDIGDHVRLSEFASLTATKKRHPMITGIHLNGDVALTTDQLNHAH